MAAGYEVCLRLHSGVPVVDLRGIWSEALADSLGHMVHSLESGGHYEIVINLQRVALVGTNAVRLLSALAQEVRTHCGHLDLVGTREQLRLLTGDLQTEPVRLACSEESALAHIKRIPVLTSGPQSTASPR